MTKPRTPTGPSITHRLELPWPKDVAELVALAKNLETDDKVPDDAHLAISADGVHCNGYGGHTWGSETTRSLYLEWETQW